MKKGEIRNTIQTFQGKNKDIQYYMHKEKKQQKNLSILCKSAPISTCPWVNQASRAFGRVLKIASG